MRLHKLTIHNFRQYIGEHEIHFAGIEENSPNVTIIWGANGYGKTGLFRAIMFCLYGDRFLDQDSLTTTQELEGLILVNEKLMEDAKGEDIKAWTKLIFDHNDRKYELSREIIGCFDLVKEKFIQQDGNVVLQETYEGNTKPIDTEEVEHVIARILPKQVKSYFLFDGERMERLTRYGAQREEIKKGIRSLLQIDDLEVAIKGLKKQEKQLTQEISNCSQGELEHINDKCMILLDEIDDLEEKHTNVKEEIKKVSQRERECEDRLLMAEKTQDKQIRREEIKSQQKELSEQKMLCNNSLRREVSCGGMHIASSLITKLYRQLKGQVDHGNLPPRIKQSFIDHLLETKRCICGTHLSNETPAREELMSFKGQRLKAVDETAFEVFQMVNKLIGRLEASKDNISTKIKEYRVIKEKNESLDTQLIAIEEELKGAEDTKILGMQLTEFREQRDDYQRQQGKIEAKLENKKREEVKLRKKSIELSELDQTAQNYSFQRTEVEKARVFLEKVKDKYTQEIRKHLEESATKIFKRIADPDTLKSLDRIVIDEKFHLDVRNYSNHSMLAQISSGQRQIVSLSYICAILDVGSNLEIPLVMDTPLGRLSGVHRDHCLKEIPKMPPQWIMLATDTEFREEEASALRSSNFWGKIYEIQPVEDRHSKIVEHNVKDWNPKRKTGESNG